MLFKKKLTLLGSLLMAILIATGCSNEKAKDPNPEPEKTPEANDQATGTEDDPLIVVNGDIINSHLVTDAICVVNSRFEQGQRLIFRADVKNAETKELIEDAKVKVVLSTGDEFDMELGPHGAEGTLLYTSGWDIPEDFSTGTIDYQYIAEVNGKEYVYEPFDVADSKLTIIDKSASTDETVAAPEEEAA